MPRAGGQYVYLREAWGDLGGFLYGWAMLIVIQTGTIAAVAVAFAKYLGVLFPSVHDTPWFRAGFLRFSPVEATGLVLIALLTWWNTTSLRGGAVLQNVFTTAKVLALAGLLVLCLAFGSNLTSPGFKWGIAAGSVSSVPLFLAFAIAAVQPLFAADAWNNVTFLSEEVKDPARNLPRSLLFATALVCGLYFLANVGYLNVLSVSEIAGAEKDRVATAAVSHAVSGAAAPRLMAAVILVSTFGCLNGLILAGARVLYAMSRDGLFFRSLGEVNPRSELPVRALVVQGVVAGLLALTGKYGDLLDFVMIATLAFYVVTIAGWWKLSRTVPALALRGVADHLVPVLYVALIVYVCAGQIVVRPMYPVWSLVLVATGVPAYFLFRKR
jgi:APA family basic amino acid/polyamine antiporter